MNINQIIIFALLIVYIYSSDSGRCVLKTTTDPSKPEDCGEPDEESKKQKYTKCCLVKYDDIANVGGELSGSTWEAGKPYCQAFREKTLKNLKTYIKYFEVENGVEKMEIDCNSNYIKLSLIGLLLFFI